MEGNELLERKIKNKINEIPYKVLLRKDFEQLGEYGKVGQVLKNLISEGKIIKAGYGIYVKAKVSSISGKIIAEISLRELAIGALTRLSIEVVEGKPTVTYNDGESIQVPTGRLIVVKNFTSRKIGYDNKYISYEYASKSQSH